MVRERDWETEREREREEQIINKIEIDTHLFVKWNDQIMLGRLRQNRTENLKIGRNRNHPLRIIKEDAIVMTVII